MNKSSLDIGMIGSIWTSFLCCLSIAIFDLFHLVPLYTFSIFFAFMFIPFIYMKFKIRDDTRSCGYILLPLFLLLRPSYVKKISLSFSRRDKENPDIIDKIGLCYYSILGFILIVIPLLAWLMHGEGSSDLFSNYTYVNALGIGIVSIFTLWRLSKVKD